MITDSPKRKWLCVEKASLAFGIINIVAAVFGIIIAIYSLVMRIPFTNFVLLPWFPESEGLTNITLLPPLQDENVNNTEPVNFADILMYYILGLFADFVIFVVAHILLVFSTFLIVGVCQKRPGFVKAFFFYGVVSVPLALLLNIVNISECIENGNINFLLWIQIGLFIAYMFFIVQLVTARKVYLNLEHPENNFEHSRLDDSTYPTI